MEEMTLELRLEEQLERQQRIRDQIEQLNLQNKPDTQETAEMNE